MRVRNRRPWARSGEKPTARSSMKPSHAANDNLIDWTRKVWKLAPGARSEPRGRPAGRRERHRLLRHSRRMVTCRAPRCCQRPVESALRGASRPDAHHAAAAQGICDVLPSRADLFGKSQVACAGPSWPGSYAGGQSAAVRYRQGRFSGYRPCNKCGLAARSHVGFRRQTGNFMLKLVGVDPKPQFA